MAKLVEILGVPQELMIDALNIAANQRKRAATKFKVGSPAWSQLTQECGTLEHLATKIKADADTPLEHAINEANKRK